MILICILLFVFASAISFLVVLYNSLITSENLMKSAFSTMDIYLKKRWDLIPNFVEIVEKYSSSEKETLEKITELRTKKYDDLSIDKKIEINEQLTKSLSVVIANTKNIPELKTNEMFIQLSIDLTKIEEYIANNRNEYNKSVKIWNNKIQMIPTSIVAKMFRYRKAKMFEDEIEG